MKKINEMWNEWQEEDDDLDDESLKKPLFDEDKIKDKFIFGNLKKPNFKNNFSQEEEEEEYDDVPFKRDKDEDDINDFTEGQSDAELADLLMDMLSRSGIENSYVNIDDEGNVTIQFLFNKTERFSKMVKVVGMLNRIASDILIQYDTDIELWETDKSEPLLTIEFTLNPNKKNRDVWGSGWGY